MPCKILRDKKHLKLINKIDIDDLRKKRKKVQSSTTNKERENLKL